MIYDQDKFQKARELCEAIKVTGYDSGHSVAVTLNGVGLLIDIKIDTSLLQPTEQDVLRRLIISASQDAHFKLREEMLNQFPKFSGMIPGMI
jgi:DNA-binding protein YbaB